MGKDLKGKELGQGIVQRISRMLRKDIMNLFMRMKKKLTFERT